MKIDAKYLVLPVLAALVLIGRVVLFENKEVSALDWDMHFRTQSKDPYGAWLLNELLQDKFEVPFYSDQFEGYQPAQEQVEHLYILIADELYLGEQQVAVIKQMLTNENDLLILSNRSSILLDLDLSVPGILDTTLAKLTLNFTNPEQQFQYCEIRENGGDTTTHAYTFWQEQASPDATVHCLWHDHIVFQSLPYGAGRLHLHQAPVFFSNFASENPFYLEHFNRVFGQFDPSGITLLQTANTVPAANSPLSYILARVNLKWAYYALWLGFLLAIVFMGKRRQKIIPLRDENLNSSIEYAKVISNLHYQQGRHTNLAKHMVAEFYHRVNKAFYLPQTSESFVDQLSIRTRLNEEDLKPLLDQIQLIESGKVIGKRTLTTFYQLLNTFYHKTGIV